jgi:hypothetical protein
MPSVTVPLPRPCTGRVVDRERLHIGQRQIAIELGQRLLGETGATRKVLVEKAPQVKLVRRGDGPGRAQQLQRRALGAPRGLDHRLVFDGVLVGLEQDAVELLADRLGALASGQRIGPCVDLLGLLPLALDGRQRGLHGLVAGLAEYTLARAAKVMWRVEQPEQHGGLVHGVGMGIEVVARQLGETELAVGGELPRQLQIEACGQRASAFDQRGRLGGIKAQQHMGDLGLDAATRVELDLQRRIGVRHHAAGQKLSGVVKQGIAHAGNCPIASASHGAQRSIGAW